MSEAPAPAGAPGIAAAILSALRTALSVVASWIASLFAPMARRRLRRARRWHIRVASRIARPPLTAAEAEHLLERSRALEDMSRLASVAAAFHLPESDFFADPAQVEAAVARILAENPPWLHLSRRIAGDEAGGGAPDTEFLYREQRTFTDEEMTLFVPEDSWRDKPLASLTLRPTRTLDEVWHARLLDQVLPPEVMLDRHTRGELMVPVRLGETHRLDFTTERRVVHQEFVRTVPVSIEMEQDGDGAGQLLYVLLDYSASMRGAPATLALAAITAAVRANLGCRRARYLFRRYAEEGEMWPRTVEPPYEADTLAEKDRFLATVLATNFSGTATHINHALDLAVSDVEALRRSEQLDADILLVTDGRAELLPSSVARVREAGIAVHAVVVSREHNAALEALCASVTVLDGGGGG